MNMSTQQTSMTHLLAHACLDECLCLIVCQVEAHQVVLATLAKQHVGLHNQLGLLSGGLMDACMIARNTQHTSTRERDKVFCWRRVDPSGVHPTTACATLHSQFFNTPRPFQTSFTVSTHSMSTTSAPIHSHLVEPGVLLQQLYKVGVLLHLRNADGKL